MSSRWEVLRKMGDWLFVEGKTTDEISSLVGHFLRRNYGIGCVYLTKEVPGGTFVTLAYIPPGRLELYEEHKEKLRQKRVETINKNREDGYKGKPNYAELNKNMPKRTGTNLYDDDEDPLSDEVLERLHGEQPDD